MSTSLHRISTRRSFIGTTLVWSGLTFSLSGRADTWPSRPIVLIVVSPAGSGPDVRAREIVARIGMSLGQAIVVENVPGGASIIGMEKARRSAPDGYSFVFTHISAVSINPSLFKTLPYDPVRDFEPVSLVSDAQMILVVPSSLGVESLAQLLELAKRKPDTLMYASAGVGTPPHIFIEQLKAATAMPIGHVPFKGSPGVVQALVAGQIAVGMEAGSAMLPLIQSGKVRALAVTGETRMASLPQVPTFGEQGVPGIVGSTWLAVMAPKGTLPEAVSALNREITRALAAPDLRRSWAALGTTVVAGPPELLAERIRAELPRWKAVIDHAGIRPE